MPSTISLPMPRRRWVPRGTASEDAAAELARSLHLPEAACRLLVARGYADEAAARRFLRPRLDQLHDPSALAGVDAAVARLAAALEREETIFVHGDYDVDGICATALYTRALRALGARVRPFVPNRLTDGYDLGPAGIAAAREAGASLILTGDCGIVAHGAVVQAAAAGLDVIVTDHHTPGATLPPAVAVVNPNRDDCAYPEKALCGTAVAFKVCQALYAQLGRDGEPLLYHLDLVALATIADLVPLAGENRVLARYGLRVLAETRTPGLRALLRRTGVGEKEAPSAGQVSHVLAPRINAVGRMGEAQWGVRLLLTDEDAEAAEIAERLEAENRSRQAEDRRTLDEALEMLERDFDPERDYALVLAGAGWHPGVIGIVASRVVERVHRPTVLLAVQAGDGPARGSARSISGFHLYDALHACSEHLERFGGHKYAAGMDIRPERIDAFREALNARAREVLAPEDLVAEVPIDLEIGLREADARLYDLLRHFGPFGMGNPTPVLAARGVTVSGSPRVVGEDHLKLALAQDGVRLGAIGFRMADRMREPGLLDGPLDVAFQLQENRWKGRVELQAKLVDLRPAGG